MRTKTVPSAYELWTERLKVKAGDIPEDPDFYPENKKNREERNKKNREERKADPEWTDDDEIAKYMKGKSRHPEGLTGRTDRTGHEIRFLLSHQEVCQRWT
jgi:hypothetical protein